MTEKRKGLTGFGIKMIAIITMLIDHIGAAVLEQGVMMETGFVGTWLYVDNILRLIGRIAFPIFCFLIVQGFQHTRDPIKYALRMLLFAFISEIPFDLAFHGSVWNFSMQNVYFTLFLGLVVLICFREMEQRLEQHWQQSIGKIVIAAAGMGAAYLLNTDYDAFGIAFIVILYATRENKAMMTVLGGLSILWEYTGILAFIPINLYNRQRGRSMKYFFYAFYPVHILLLYFVREFIVLPML